MSNPNPTKTQLDALDRSRKKLWEDPTHREKMRRVASETMTRTNQKRAAGLYPEWDKKHKEWSSKSCNERWADGSISKSQHKRCGKFRSRLELKFSRFLDVLELKWEYEPKSFSILLNGRVCTYTPDFYIPELDYWVETKGFWRDEESKQKVEAFMRQYPNLNFMVVHGNKKPGFKILLEN